MYHEKPMHVFVKFALPQMAGLLFNSAYLIIDGIFIGHRLGRDALAAAAVAVPAVELLIALGFAIASGAGVLISGALGRGDSHEANRLFNLSMALTGAAGAALMVPGVAFIHSLTRWLGSTPEIHAEAATYLGYIVVFAPFLLFSFLMSGLARCDGRPKLAMAALAIGALSNIALDYILMYPLNMGLAGAALATGLGPVFSVLILLPHFLRKRGALFFAAFKKKAGDIRRMATLGAPAFVAEFGIGFTALVYNRAMLRLGFGETGLAAYLIIGYIILIILSLFLGMAQGLQPVFSYYHGAGDSPRIRALLRFSLKAVILLGIGTTLGILLFSRGFITFFTPGNPALLDFTTQKAIWYFSGFVFAGINLLLIAFLQAREAAGQALMVSLLRSAVFLPVLCAVLPFFTGAESIWFCQSLAEAATTFATLKIIRCAISENSV